MRKVYVDVKVRLIIRTNDDVNIDNVLNEMDYEFVSQTDGADIEDTEIKEYNIEDSK